MPPLPLSPQVFAILAPLIEERLGLHYGLADRELLEDKVSLRAQEAGFESLLDYYYFLRYDPGAEAELAALTEALVVRETYFFRELAPLEVLCDQYVRPWVEAGRRPRVWCAASATGEEPLTLAMLLEARGLLDRVDVLATDISAQALQRAKSGRFSPRSLRGDPAPKLARRFLEPVDGGWQVPRRLVEKVRWERVNLVDASQVSAVGAVDAVLCRNVLIYFRDDTVRGVVERLANALTPGGVLLVGVSESLLRFGTALVGEEHGGVFVYRRAER